MQPSTSKAIAFPKPAAEKDGEDSAGRHDAVKQFAFHNFEAFNADDIARQRVVNKKAWKIK